MTSVALANLAEARRLHVLALLRELEGQGRPALWTAPSTRWNLVTDEDRVAARAAHLAKQRRRKAS